MLASAFSLSSEVNLAGIDALYAIACQFLDSDRLVDAARAFRVLVRAVPTDERGWLGLARCHEELDQDDVAMELYGAGAIVTSPRSVRCMIGRARLFRRNGDPAAAESYIDEAERMAADSDEPELVSLVEAERRS